MANIQPKDNIGVGKGKGRPAGSLNKTTVAAKEAISLAAEGLGGTQRLIDWAKEDPKNEASFWTSIYPKLLPLQVSGEMTFKGLAAELLALDDKSSPASN